MNINSRNPVFDHKKINETINFLQDILNRIKEKFIEIYESKTEEKELNEFENERENILNLMDEISKSLEENPLFENNEYYDFISIYDMIEYLLNDKNLFLKHRTMLEEMITEFNNIISYKLECKLKNIDYSQYKKQYERFNSYIINKEENFYLEIYQDNGTDEELIKKVASRL